MSMTAPSPLELRHFRYFLAVAEDLHFGRAAARLNIVQPALSMQIKALEEMLGVRLLNRTNRHVELTAAGRIFLDEVRGILTQVDHAAETASRAGRGEFGKLRISYSGNAAYAGVMAAAIGRFRRRYPEVEILLQEMPTRAQFKELQEGRLDLGYVTLFSLVVPDDLRIFRVGVWPWMVALPSGHPQADREIVDLDLLADELFLVYSDSDADIELLPILRRFGGFHPRKIQRLSNTMTIMTMVAAGLGVAIVPATLSKIQVENVIYRKLPENGERAELAIACQAEGLNPIIGNFIRLSQDA